MRLWGRGGFDVVLSRYILNETARILPHVSRLPLDAERLRCLIDDVVAHAAIIEPDTVQEPMLRDPADQFILGTLRAAKADYLITGDKDLLSLAAKYPILSPSAFWKQHGLQPQFSVPVSKA